MLKAITVDTMSYPALSMTSLVSILRDLDFTVQMLSHPKHTHTMEISQLASALSPAVLRVLMIVYSQCYSLYLLSEQDGEGLDNDTLFREELVIPGITMILDIVYSVLSSAEFRMVVYNTDPIEFVRNLCFFGNVTLSPQFILQSETYIYEMALSIVKLPQKDRKPHGSFQ